MPEKPRQTVDFQYHHQANQTIVQRFANARRMGKHQRTLKIFQLFCGYARLRQQAKTGIDAVGGAAFGQDRINAADAVVDRRDRALIQRYAHRLAVYLT